jgi:hypothetical protein
MEFKLNYYSFLLDLHNNPAMKITLLLVFIVLTVDVIGFEVVSSNAVPLGILLPYNSTMVPSTKLCCFMNSGYELASLEFAYNGPTSAWVSTTTISSCRNAELSMDILITPNLYASVNDQVAKIFTTIEASSYGMIWINVDAQPTFKPSCNFLAQMVNGISQKGKTVGIRSSK